MFYKDYKIIYEKIANDLDIEKKDDIKSAIVLNTLLKNKDLISKNYLKKIIKEKEVFVFGAGISLVDSISKYKSSFKDKLIISADGATSALLEKNILPDIIVTDLDGKISDQIKSNSKGSIVILHAHGDNIDKIEKYVTKFKGKMVGSTQVNPKQYKNLHNFFGFTDGDRAVYLADYFNAKKIFLIGFNYEGNIGRYSFSKNKDKNKKIKKLKWCKYLIDELQKKNKSIIYL